MSDAGIILLLGASGPVGRCFIDRTAGQQVRIIAVSRRNPARSRPHVTWLQHDLENAPADVRAGTLISFGPLAHTLSQVAQGIGLGRVIALSSASTLFKQHSADRAEQRRISALARCEAALADICRKRGIVLTLLKPTLTYGGGKERDPVGRLAALAQRHSILPYAGRGLRSPVHVDDLARLAVQCVISGPSSEGSWLLGGAETLTYPELLRRAAASQGRPVRLLRLPAWLMKTLLRGAHLSGRMRDISPVMIDRQSMDLVVDDTPARERLAWNPRPFRPDPGP